MLLRLLGSNLIPYLVAGIGAIILILAAAVWVQTVRLGHAKNQLEACNQRIERAVTESKERAANTGIKAVESFQEKQHEDRKPVERVVTRINNVCLRKQGDLLLPSATGELEKADAETEDSGDDAFIRAAGDDIESCSTALNQCDAVLDFVCKNGGCP